MIYKIRLNILILLYKCHYLLISRLRLIAVREEKWILLSSPAYAVLSTPDCKCRDLISILHSELEYLLIEICLLLSI